MIKGFIKKKKEIKSEKESETKLNEKKGGGGKQKTRRRAERLHSPGLLWLFDGQAQAEWEVESERALEK